MSKVIYEVKENIGQIILNDPKNLNAIDDSMAEDLLAALQQAEADPEAKVITITAAGKVFCGGGNLKHILSQFEANPDYDLHDLAKKVADASLFMKKCKKLIVIGSQAAAAGAGFNLALAGDFLIASEECQFIQAFVKIGLVPDMGGSYLLSRAVGANKAAQLALTGNPVKAQEGLELGFIHQVVANDELEGAVFDLAKKLARGPLKAYELIKAELFEASFKDFEAYLETESHLQSEASHTEDFKEGVRAFVEKRRANFVGK